MNKLQLTDSNIKMLAKEYVFTKTTYKALAQKYGWSDSKISHIMNHELQDISKFWYKLVCWKANKNKKDNMKKIMNK